MKNIFIIWITIQLILIGIASVKIHNEIKQETYDCKATTKIPEWLGALVPLTAFVPQKTEECTYCLKKAIKEEICQIGANAN